MKYSNFKAEERSKHNVYRSHARIPKFRHQWQQTKHNCNHPIYLVVAIMFSLLPLVARFWYTCMRPVHNMLCTLIYRYRAKSTPLSYIIWLDPTLWQAMCYDNLLAAQDGLVVEMLLCRSLRVEESSVVRSLRSVTLVFTSSRAATAPASAAKKCPITLSEQNIYTMETMALFPN